jgi:hypothetical protein
MDGDAIDLAREELLMALAAVVPDDQAARIATAVDALISAWIDASD